MQSRDLDPVPPLVFQLRYRGSKHLPSKRFARPQFSNVALRYSSGTNFFYLPSFVYSWRMESSFRFLLAAVFPSRFCYRESKRIPGYGLGGLSSRDRAGLSAGNDGQTCHAGVEIDTRRTTTAVMDIGGGMKPNKSSRGIRVPQVHQPWKPALGRTTPGAPRSAGLSLKVTYTT